MELELKPSNSNTLYSPYWWNTMWPTVLSDLPSGELLPNSLDYRGLQPSASSTGAAFLTLSVPGPQSTNSAGLKASHRTCKTGHPIPILPRQRVCHLSSCQVLPQMTRCFWHWLSTSQQEEVRKSLFTVISVSFLPHVSPTPFGRRLLSKFRGF